MSDKDFDKIRQIAENHIIEPRSEAWKKLDDKMKSKKAKVRMINYRNIAVAAIVISIVSITTVFSMYLKDHDPDVFASNEVYRPIVLEDLLTTVEDDSFFDVGHIEQLNDAYARIDFRYQ